MTNFFLLFLLKFVAIEVCGDGSISTDRPLEMTILKLISRKSLWNKPFFLPWLKTDILVVHQFVPIEIPRTTIA